MSAAGDRARPVYIYIYIYIYTYIYIYIHTYIDQLLARPVTARQHTSAYVSIRQHMLTYADVCAPCDRAFLYFNASAIQLLRTQLVQHASS